MPTDLETYLAEVEERARQSESDWDQLIASQADVPTLVAMLRKFRIRYPRKPRHGCCHCGPCAHYTRIDQLAREAMEKRGG